MNVQEVINIARQLPLAEKRQVLMALEADFHSAEAKPLATANGMEEVRRRRMIWLKANRAVYGGQYVVMDGYRLLGTARSYREGRELARASGVPDAFVDYLSKPNKDGEMGGW